jgi:hypothetical protein
MGTWPSASVFGRLAIVGSTCILLACGVGAPEEDATAGPATPGAAGAAPDRRTHHALVHHAGEGRTYLIGGSTRRGEGYHYFDDMWFWNGTDWTEVSPLPFPRSSHGVVYHAERDSLILFGGGFARAVRAEGVLWEWRRGEWNALGGDSRAGTDTKGNRIVLFGGGGPDGDLGDTWTWDGQRWDEVSTEGPSARMGVKLASSEAGVVLFGGREATSAGFQDHGDTWELQKRSWIRRHD